MLTCYLYIYMVKIASIVTTYIRRQILGIDMNTHTTYINIHHVVPRGMCFLVSHEISGCPVKFPLNQSIDSFRKPFRPRQLTSQRALPFGYGAECHLLHFAATAARGILDIHGIYVYNNIIQ